MRCMTTGPGCDAPPAPSPSPLPSSASCPAAPPPLVLRGASSFLRHNPLSDRFPVHRFHSLEFWCSDATNTYKRFQHALGMTLVAKSDLSTSNSLCASYILKSNDLVFAFTAPYARSAAQYSPEPRVPLPQYNQEEAHAFVVKHGMAVRAVGLQVSDAAAAFHASVDNGAVPVTAPHVLQDRTSGTAATVAEVRLYGDVVLRYISGDFAGPYLPNYQPTPDQPKICYGITRLDHAVGNVHNLVEAASYVMRLTGFHQFAEFCSEDVGTLDSGLNSVVLANNNEMVLLPINEPTHGTPRKSQIQTYLEQNEGPGLQHLALKTNDIFRTLREMQSRSSSGGFEFMPRPSALYYKELPAKIGGLLSPDQYKLVEEMGILADKDDQGVLLQTFTKPLGDRPTIFIEIIERIGCLRRRAAPGAVQQAVQQGDAVDEVQQAVQGLAVEPDEDGWCDLQRQAVQDQGPQGGAVQAVQAAASGIEQAAGCGGFGKGNFSELFKRIEAYERTLSIQR